ncbi:MAG: FtsX-like permease family protein [Verrucomicrobiota bacterium]
MNVPALILRELGHRRLQAALTLLGLTIAVALLTAVQLVTSAAERETRRVMRDLGFNLRIVSRDTDPAYFWREGHSDRTLPESSIQSLAAQHGIFITFNHLTPTLERRAVIQGHDALITGLGPSVIGPGEKKQPMGFVIPNGSFFLGATIARSLGAERGGTVTLSNRTFRVERVLSESGTEDDVRIFTSLSDAQSLLQLPGQISEIKAVDCLCLTPDQDPLGQIRKALARALPEATVFQVRHLAEARARQRRMTEHFTQFAVPMTLGAAAIWTGLLMMLNVRERRSEIGLWRALGSGSASVAALFLGRAILLGIMAAALGWAFGTGAALRWGPGLFPVTSGALSADWGFLRIALLTTPALAAAASFLPSMMAVAQDPADTLRAD